MDLMSGSLRDRRGKGLVFLVFVGLAVLFLTMGGCGSGESSPHMLLAVQGAHLVGALNARDTEQAQVLLTQLLNASQNFQWPTFAARDTSPDLRDLLPPKVGAWRLGKDVRVYQGERIKEYLPHSQIFHDYGFVAMVGSGYFNRHLSKEAILQVDLFDMGTPLNAFGIYSLHRNAQVRPVRIGGGEAIITPDSLDAWQGPYYLRIQSWAIADAFSEGMEQIAKAILRQMPRNTDLTPLWALFPTTGKLVATERFFRTYRAFDQIAPLPEANVFHLTPETRGMLAEYENKGRSLAFDTLMLFLITYPTPEAALQAYESTREFVSRNAPVLDAGLGQRSFIAPMTLR